MTSIQNTFSTPTFAGAASAFFSREWISHRLNRFLYAHVALTVAAGCLVLLSPAEAMAGGASWWILHAVLYAISLSAVLLGLSSAHAETDEFPILLTQPAGTSALVAGKLVALLGIVMLSSALLALPAWSAGAWSASLPGIVVAAAGVTAVCAALGLALGFWVRDGVRGLIAAIGLWFVLLFGTDLFLLAVAGAPWVQHHADAWIVPLMLNPLDAFRVTVLFASERVAFAGLGAGHLAGWWVQHAFAWLATLLAGWLALASALACLGARRRVES